jgi:hypothetical protein
LAAPGVDAGLGDGAVRGTQPVVCVLAFSGAAASPLDQQAGTSAGASGATVQPGSVTPTVDGEVLVAGYSGYFADVSSIDSSFTITDQFSSSGGHHLTTAAAYKIQTAASAENPTWTLGGSNINAAGIATFKAA